MALMADRLFSAASSIIRNPGRRRTLSELIDSMSKISAADQS
jgi:hypothetical protein